MKCAICHKASCVCGCDRYEEEEEDAKPLAFTDADGGEWEPAGPIAWSNTQAFLFAGFAFFCGLLTGLAVTAR